MGSLRCYRKSNFYSSRSKPDFFVEGQKMSSPKNRREKILLKYHAALQKEKCRRLSVPRRIRRRMVPRLKEGFKQRRRKQLRLMNNYSEKIFSNR